MRFDANSISVSDMEEFHAFTEQLGVEIEDFQFDSHTETLEITLDTSKLNRKTAKEIHEDIEFDNEVIEEFINQLGQSKVSQSFYEKALEATKSLKGKTFGISAAPMVLHQTVNNVAIQNTLRDTSSAQAVHPVVGAVLMTTMVVAVAATAFLAVKLMFDL